MAEAPGYIAAQVIGGAVGPSCSIPSHPARPRFALTGGSAANGYAEHSLRGYTLMAGFVTEAVMTFFFLLIILGTTAKRAPTGFAPIAIGLGLTLST